MKKGLLRVLVSAAIVAVLSPAPLFGGEGKVALVLGNGSYTKIQPLANPVNDAADMAAALGRMGFTVLSATDADRRTMRTRIDEFSRAIRGASIALFYYSGHGVQLDGENYLVPVHAEVSVPGDVPDECVPLSRITARMEEARAGTNVIILDACRDNPFRAVTRGIERGLAVIGRKPPESIIVYATAENEKAEDGSGRNGVFTAALLRHIERKEAFTDILLDVKAEVRAATSDKQKPANYDNLTRKVHLFGSDAAAKPVPRPASEPSGADAVRAAEELRRGIALYYGRGVKEDREEAKRRIETAANLGSARAQFQLASMHLFQRSYARTGAGDLGSLDEAVKWLRIAAEAGFPQAQLYLGGLYRDGAGGLAKSEAEAKKWFDRATAQLPAMLRDAKEGDVETLRTLSILYSMGFGVQKDESEARKWFRRLLEVSRSDAEGGSLSAQMFLAEQALYGDDGLEPNEAEAAKWYRRAADQGSLEAMFMLGGMCLEGRGIAKDAAEALRLLRKAAEGGHEGARCRLGMLYISGNVVKKDVEEGLRWYVKAAEKGSIQAMLDLGDLYSAGSGVPKNPAEAANWYRKAAELGNTYAQYNLGRIFEDGAGVGQNYTEAAKWYGRAAEQGHAEAQNCLAGLYEEGLGVIQDFVLAHMWYNLETMFRYDEDGRAEAASKRDAVAKRMTPGQIAEAQKLAREWMENHPGLKP